MPIKVSVVNGTKRAGSMDILKYNLMNQTLPKSDFELIIVDELYEKRHDVVEEYFKGSGINLVQVNASKENHPKWKPWSWTFGRTKNLGLAYARGEVLVHCDDYWIFTPTTLEAIVAAWEEWGDQGVCVPMTVHFTHSNKVKSSFMQYSHARRQMWNERGGSDNLDTPPDTYISIYTEDFSNNPKIVKVANDEDELRCPAARVLGKMDEPRPDDIPRLKKWHVGETGGFKYWLSRHGAIWGLVMPVAASVRVNGVNDFLNGKWGSWGELNSRMHYAFNVRYVSTMNAMSCILHQIEWGYDNPRGLPRGPEGGENAGTPELMEAIARAEKGDCWAHNPWNLAEERAKAKHGVKTLIF